MINLNVFQYCALVKSTDKWRKKNRGRLEVLKEWLKTEQDYVNYLAFMKFEVRHIIVNQIKMKEKLYHEIFGNLEELYLLHVDFNQDLKKAFELKEEPDFKFGKILLSYIPGFQEYAAYFRTLDNRKNILKQEEQKGSLEKFKTYFRENSKTYIDKYGNSLISFLEKIQLVDYLCKPFQRLYNYELILKRYIEFISPLNKERLILRECLKEFQSKVQEINDRISSINNKMILELEKKYKGIYTADRFFENQFVTSYIEQSELLDCRLYLMSDMILMVDSKKNREIKRIKLDHKSWWHHFRIGKEITTAVYIRGDNSQSFLFTPQYMTQFIESLNKINNKLILRNSYIRTSRNLQVKSELVIRPLYVSRLVNGQALFLIYIKKSSQEGGVYNYFTLGELKTLVDYVEARHKIKGRTMQQITNLHFSSFLEGAILTDFECERIAIGLMDYLFAVISRSELLKDIEIQYLLKLGDYLSSKLERREQKGFKKQISIAQSRVRFEEIDFKEEQMVEVDVVITKDKNKRLKIGKYQRIYSIVHRVMNNQQNCFDYTLSLQCNGRQIILDEDFILYDLLKKLKYTFKDSKFEFFWNKLNQMLSGNYTIRLKKYMHLETIYKDMVQQYSGTRIQYLCYDIQVVIEKRTVKLNFSIGSELVALLRKLTKDLSDNYVKDFYLKKIENKGHSYAQFMAKVKEDAKRIQNQNTHTCFTGLLNIVEYWNEYCLRINCKLNQEKVELCLRYDYIELKSHEKQMLRIPFEELQYTYTPSYIKILYQEQYILEMDWVYGFVYVVERYRIVRKS